MNSVLRTSANRERSVIAGLAVAVAAMVAVYLGLRSSVLDSGQTGSLLPYQMLVRDLVQSDHAVFDDLRKSLLDAEAGRTRTASWPDPATLPALPASPYRWVRSRQNVVVNYLGLPADEVSAPAWLMKIQEPDPAAMSKDPAPNDEEHHRLADGTVLHVSIWTHRFGGQVPPDFVLRPETAGWTQLLTAPLNPIASARK